MLFNYLKTESYMDSIDILDIGNCCLVAYNDDGNKWAFYTKTELGWSVIKIVGPFDAEDDSMGSFFTYYKNGFEYSEKKLHKQINDFLNNPKNKITQVFECNKDDIKTILSSIVL